MRLRPLSRMRQAERQRYQGREDPPSNATRAWHASVERHHSIMLQRRPAEKSAAEAPEGLERNMRGWNKASFPRILFWCPNKSTVCEFWCLGLSDGVLLNAISVEHDPVFDFSGLFALQASNSYDYPSHWCRSNQTLIAGRRNR